ESEKSGMAEREDPAITPHQIDRQCERGVAKILADQLQHPGRHMESVACRHQEIEESRHDSHRQHQRDEPAQLSVKALPEEARDHSTARPFSANSPRGRRWMKRMMKTSTRILPRTAPA